MIKKISLVACSVFVAVVLFAAPNYSKPVGHVNDFANIMSDESKQQLESQLWDYREKTSIELAVVTVPSLEGLTVEEYSLGLSQVWGVGDKKKDNGIVLLIAPNERKMRIETGYGIEPDLTDAQCGRIIRDVIIPYFKESVNQPNDVAKNAKLTGGIIAGVNAILAGLGDTPFEARIEERRIAAEKTAAEQKLRDEQITAFFAVAVPMVLVIGVLMVIVVLIYSWNARRNRLKKLYIENTHSLKICEDSIKEAERELPKAHVKLEQLQKDNPKEVWADLENGLKKLPANIESQKKKLASLREEHQNSDWRNSEEVYGKIIIPLSAISVSLGFLGSVANKIVEINNAKVRSAKLIDSIPDSIKTARKELDNKDVKDKSRKYLNQADDKYNKAKSLSDNQSINWLIVFALLAEALSLITSAKSQAESDKEDAEEERNPKPRQSSDDSYGSSSYSSSSSSSWSSSNSSSSSSFGGFGGGSFGGGGASGSW